MQTEPTLHPAQVIRALREKAGLTQQAIADELGCSQPHVHYLESRDVKSPRTSAAIAEGLKKLREKYATQLAA